MRKVPSARTRRSWTAGVPPARQGGAIPCAWCHSAREATGVDFGQILERDGLDAVLDIARHAPEGSVRLAAWQFIADLGYGAALRALGLPDEAMH